MVINPFRNRIQYVVERLLLSGTLSRLAVAAVLIALVAGITGMLGFLVALGSEQSFSNPFEAIWWAFLRLSDPGYLGDDEGFGLRLVSTIVTIAGYVLFLGVLVAILTQGLNEWISRLEQGLSPISAKNHVIFLGWSDRMPGIIRNMVASEQSLLHFLRRVGARRLKLVLLVEEVMPMHTRELRNHLGSDWKAQQVILRSGTPLRLDHLKRVDYLRASAIVLAAESRGPGRSASQSDNSAIKTILSISQSLKFLDSDQSPPLLVTELYDARKTLIALHSYRGPIEVIAGDQVVSRMVAQMARRPRISHVYRELLTHDLGNEIHARSCPESQVGTLFWSLAEALEDTILLGVARSSAEGIVPHLNPDADFRFEKDDKLICIARDRDVSLTPCAKTKKTWPRPERELEKVSRGTLRILVLGWSRRIPALLEELDSYQNQLFEITIASREPLAERARKIGHYGVKHERVRLEQIETDTTVPEMLAALRPEAYDVVLCLASDVTQSVQEADARTLVSYSLLNDMMHGIAFKERPRIVVELLDELNVALLDPEQCEYLLSPQVLSHMVAQVALRRELNAVFQELFNSGETEITIRDFHRYGLSEGGEITFPEIEAAARAHGEIALGVIKATERFDPAGGTHLNPDRKRVWILETDDLIVVLQG